MAIISIRNNNVMLNRARPQVTIKKQHKLSQVTRRTTYVSSKWIMKIILI